MLLSRKRPHSPDSTNDHSCGRNHCSNYMTFVLESESPVPTDEDSESSDSIQLAGTASAKDTSDTSWSSNSVTMDVEYEEYDVASITHSDEKLMSNCDSSGSDDMLHTDTATTTKVAVNLCEERDIWADSSNVESDATTDSEIPRADYWECVRCKSKCTPLLRYCLKCFQLRKGYFPERPKRIHPRRRKAEKLRPGSDLAKASSATSDTERIHSSASESLTEDPGALTRGDSGISVGTVEEGRLDLSPKGTEIAALSSSGNREPEPDRHSELCFMCVERPKTGGFVHKKTVHVLGCYQCSLQVWNRTRRCPLCNKRPQNVARVIFG